MGDDPDADMRVIVFAGPNGSGKSTINEAFLNDPRSRFTGEYINADDIAKTLTAQYPDYTARNIAAAEIAEARRKDAIAQGKPFAFETVMSTPEKIAILTQAKARGYEVTLVFVTTDDPQKNVGRVAQRVVTGGHAVEPAAIVSRYHKAMALMPAAIEHADRAFVFDNSYAAPQLVASKERGVLTVKTLPDMPRWVEENLNQPYRAREKSMLAIAQVIDQIAQVKPAGSAAIETTPADASHRMTYTGKILAVSSHHALQQESTTKRLVVHDLSLLPPLHLQRGQDLSVAYAYDKGKIIQSEVGREGR